MEPMGRDVGARGRAVDGLAVEVNGLAGSVVVTCVVVRGPEQQKGRGHESDADGWRGVGMEEDLFDSSKTG